MTAAQLRRLERIMEEGSVNVRCSAKCGHSATVEPDADHKCSECGKGRLTSPLVKLGLI